MWGGSIHGQENLHGQYTEQKYCYYVPTVFLSMILLKLMTKSHGLYILSAKRLLAIRQSKVRIILEEADIRPNKITYYCESRDIDFDWKMHNFLLGYKQLLLQFDELNEEAAVYHWKYKLEEINPSEEVVVDTLQIKKFS